MMKKIQRYEGDENYGDISLHLGGYSEKKQTYRNVKLCIIAVISLCVLAALETTVLSRVPLLILPSASPSLCLLTVLARGYLLGEKEGGVCGLLGGLIMECANMEPIFGGIMVLPLVYALLGYTAGALSKKLLAGNLASFEVYALAGLFIDHLVKLVLTMVRAGDISFGAYLLGGVLPNLILSLTFAPLIYGAVKWMARSADS